VAVWTVLLALASFTAGVVSTMLWLRPASGILHEGSRAAVVAAALVVALVLAAVATLAVRRATTDALARFSADVNELAAGRPGSVADPMGTGPTAELAATLNRILGRG
jgi:hypothetical protein